jgi:cell division protein FtsI/penicillin-binding protein 2
VLAIDSNIQMIAEQELAAAVTEFRAESGEVIVIDPRTGEVLALANYPTFHPQNLEDSRPEQRLNRAIVVPYEPGSTFKPFIAGPALMWRQTRPAEVWPINALTYVAPYGRGRRVTDVHHYGPLCTWDVLVKSSNIGMALLATRMGNPSLHRAVTLFGFGRPTGIELPGEDPGLVYPLGRWTRYSTESIAQGYEVMITPMQLARAFCVYANGGHLVDPRIVRGRLDADGGVIERYPSRRLEDYPQVLDADSAAAMRQILSDVVIRGTGTRARSRGWNLFGKTGTSHISMGRSGYSQDLVNSSFIAGAPLENPRLVIAMVIHRADRRVNRAYGGTVAAPAAGRVLERSLAYMQVPPSPPLAPPPPHIASVLHNYNPRLYVDPPVAGR